MEEVVIWVQMMMLSVIVLLDTLVDAVNNVVLGMRVTQQVLEVHVNPGLKNCVVKLDQGKYLQMEDVTVR